LRRDFRPSRGKPHHPVGTTLGRVARARVTAWRKAFRRPRWARIPQRRKARGTCPSTSRQERPKSKVLDAQADVHYARGEHAGITGDKYIRVTVILASVLFLVGISSHFPLRGVRIGLVTVGAVLPLFAAVQILQLPGPRPEGKYADHPVRTT
jgi:hypothetical protein